MSDTPELADKLNDPTTAITKIFSDYVQPRIEELSGVRMISALVSRLHYKRGWVFAVVPWPSLLASGYGSDTALRIQVETEDSTGRFASPHIRLCDRCQAHERDEDLQQTLYESITRTSFMEPRRRYQPFWVAHHIKIPPYDMDYVCAERWLLDSILDVERHEACEFFKIDGKAPYFPDHKQPYVLRRVNDAPTEFQPRWQPNNKYLGLMNG